MIKQFCSFACLLFCLTICSCSKQSSPSPKPFEAHAETSDATPVAVAGVKRQNLSRSLTLAAEFRPYQEIDLHAKVAGYVSSINVDVGDRVRQGQIIAQLEIPEFKSDL